MNQNEQLLTCLRRHEGIWTGSYKHVNLEGQIIDEHASLVECVFPDQGPHVYVQKNVFQWQDGREERHEFGGVLENGRIVWDTDRFFGYAWHTDNDVILLKLTRKDEPDTTFLEIILLEPNQSQRCRTWHWFKSGVPIRRTLCDEHRNL